MGYFVWQWAQMYTDNVQRFTYYWRKITDHEICLLFQFRKLSISTHEIYVAGKVTSSGTFHGFFQLLGKICRHHWKELLKTNKIAKFESDSSKTNEDVTPQRGEISQTFVWWWRKGRGVGDKLVTPPYKRL